MSEHIYNFEGGRELTTMGASWFVSYSYYKLVDSSHTNWNLVDTYKARISIYDNTRKYHKFWLSKVKDMNDSNLKKNKILLSPIDIKIMADRLLLKMK